MYRRFLLAQDLLPTQTHAHLWAYDKNHRKHGDGHRNLHSDLDGAAVLFTCVGSLLLGELEEYSNFADTFVMLFETALGMWDLSIYDSLSLGRYVGVTFHLIVLMMNLVLLLNLIIAVLSNTYTVYEPKSLALYYDGVIESIPMYKYSKIYGALVCGQPPFNAISFLFLPGFMLIQDVARLKAFNEAILHLLYFPIALGCLSFFFLFNLLLLPLSYFWSLAFKVNILINDLQKPKSESLTDIVFFVIFGVPLLLAAQIVDIFYFLQHLYMKNNEKLSNFQRNQINVDGLLKLLDHTKKVMKCQAHLGEKGQQILMVEFVNKLRQILDVDRKIYNIIFGSNVIRKKDGIKKFDMQNHQNTKSSKTLMSVKSFFLVKTNIEQENFDESQKKAFLDA